MKFLGQQRDNALKGLPDAPDLFRSFSNQMQQIEQNVLAEHRRFVQDKLKEDILETHYQELAGALKVAQQSGNYDGALEDINAVNGSARFTRMLSRAEQRPDGKGPHRPGPPHGVQRLRRRCPEAARPGTA